MKYEIRRSLVLSTVHITRDDDLLMADDSLDFAQVALAYGWQVWVGTTDTEDIASHAKKLGFSDAFCDLLRLGHRLGCTHLVLDCDGPIRDDLPRFDW